MSATEPITDVEVVGTDLEPVASHAPSTLFRTSDPVQVIEEAARIADALKDLLRKQKLTTNIQGREHVLVEGWTTLGSMLGVVPVVEWTRQTDDGWEARVAAKTLDGRVVGAAEASCTRSERTWKSRDDYALRSMAQTRATSKALRGPLGFIVTLAGYEATPSEEMPEPSAPAAEAGPAFGPPLAQEHKARYAEALKTLTTLDTNGLMALNARIKQHAGGYLPDLLADVLTEVALSREPVPFDETPPVPEPEPPELS